MKKKKIEIEKKKTGKCVICGGYVADVERTDNLCPVCFEEVAGIPADHWSLDGGYSAVEGTEFEEANGL